MDAVARREAAADIEYLTAEIPSAIDQTLDGIGRVATIVRALKEFAHPDQKDMTATDLNQAVLCTLTVARNEVKYVADVETELGDLPLVVCHPRRAQPGDPEPRRQRRPRHRGRRGGHRSVAVSSA